MVMEVVTSSMVMEVVTSSMVLEVVTSSMVLELVTSSRVLEVVTSSRMHQPLEDRNILIRGECYALRGHTARVLLVTLKFDSSEVDYYSPRFLVHAATAVLPVNATGVVYRAWSTDEDLGLTCPLGPGDSARCPCASVTYQLFAPPGDHHFLLDPVSGILTRNTNTSLQPGTAYTYKLMVQGTPLAGQMEELLYDLLDLRIYVSADYIKKIPWT
nr:uncharacterized protein LOC128692871 [Cherax quadricarinatus]